MVNKNIVGIIHARGGSKRIPLKNIKLLNGKPLISYMVNAALGSKYLRRVIVSTDHPEIKRISLDCGAEVPFERPQKLAEDCPSECVTKHAVEFVEREESMEIDIVVTMQPTTPFCLSEDIDACVDILLSEKKLNSVFSSSIISERPEWMFLVKNKREVRLFRDNELKGEIGISQALPKMIIPNGAVYATRRHSLFDAGVIITKKSGTHIMSPERSIDIDEPIDFKFAEFVIKEGYL